MLIGNFPKAESIDEDGLLMYAPPNGNKLYKITMKDLRGGKGLKYWKEDNKYIMHELTNEVPFIHNGRFTVPGNAEMVVRYDLINVHGSYFYSILPNGDKIPGSPALDSSILNFTRVAVEGSGYVAKDIYYLRRTSDVPVLGGSCFYHYWNGSQSRLANETFTLDGTTYNTLDFALPGWLLMSTDPSLLDFELVHINQLGVEEVITTVHALADPITYGELDYYVNGYIPPAIYEHLFIDPTDSIPIKPGVGNIDPDEARAGLSIYIGTLRVTPYQDTFPDGQTRAVFAGYDDDYYRGDTGGLYYDDTSQGSSLPSLPTRQTWRGSVVYLNSRYGSDSILVPRYNLNVISDANPAEYYSYTFPECDLFQDYKDMDRDDWITYGLTTTKSYWGRSEVSWEDEQGNIHYYNFNQRSEDPPIEIYSPNATSALDGHTFDRIDRPNSNIAYLGKVAEVSGVSYSAGPGKDAVSYIFHDGGIEKVNHINTGIMCDPDRQIAFYTSKYSGDIEKIDDIIPEEEYMTAIIYSNGQFYGTDYYIKNVMTGQYQRLADVVGAEVVPIVTEGTEIATINGTSIYAPSGGGGANMTCTLVYDNPSGPSTGMGRINLINSDYYPWDMLEILMTVDGQGNTPFYVYNQCKLLGSGTNINRTFYTKASQYINMNIYNRGNGATAGHEYDVYYLYVLGASDPASNIIRKIYAYTF